MPPKLCEICNKSRALVVRSKTRQRVCEPCFFDAFETEIHHTIIENALFHPGERIAIGASGGKDSTVLASVLKTLNERYNYGCEFILLSIDEGIKGYRDDSLETVKRNAAQYDMELCILGYDELYGWTMDQVVQQIGKKGNCTYCGVFRRQALDRGAARLGVKHVVTGHNADDVAETVLMNLLRGDLPRLSRTTSIVTSTPSAVASTADGVPNHTNIKRSKPLKYAYEKEIVLYAQHKKLDYFSTECTYSPEAFRGSARSLIKNLERIRPIAILDIVRSGEDMARLVPGSGDGCGGSCGSNTLAAEEEAGGCGSANGRAAGSEMANMEERLQQNEQAAEQGLETEITASGTKHDSGVDSDSQVQKAENKNGRTLLKPAKAAKINKQTMGRCERCGYLSSQAVCKACVLLEGLNKSRPKTAIGAESAHVDAITNGVKNTEISPG